MSSSCRRFVSRRLFEHLPYFQNLQPCLKAPLNLQVRCHTFETFQNWGPNVCLVGILACYLTFRDEAGVRLFCQAPNSSGRFGFSVREPCAIIGPRRGCCRGERMSYGWWTRGEVRKVVARGGLGRGRKKEEWREAPVARTDCGSYHRTAFLGGAG